MITKDDLVSDIRNYVDEIAQLYFKLEMKRASRNRLDTSLRSDIETILTALQNSIDTFNLRFKDNSSPKLIAEIDQIQENLDSQTPEILKPQD